MPSTQAAPQKLPFPTGTSSTSSAINLDSEINSSSRSKGSSEGPWKLEGDMGGAGEGEVLVEVTLVDMGDELTMVQPVHQQVPAMANKAEDPEAFLLEQDSSKRRSFRDLMRHASMNSRTASARLKQFSQELKRIYHGSFDRNLNSKFSSKRGSSSSSHGAQFAMQALQSLNKITANADRSLLWEAVQSRFYLLASQDGLLPRQQFGPCIDVGLQSQEFADSLFDALSRRSDHTSQFLHIEELRDFWEQICDQGFDSRLQLFFEMCEGNGDDQISEEDVKEIIALSATTSKLKKLQEQAEEYASLIMEHLDPDHTGFIELWQLEALLEKQRTALEMDSSIHNQNFSQTLVAPRRRNIFSRLTRETIYLLDEHWRRIWVLLVWILAMAGLFVWKFLQYKNRASFQIMGYCVCTAKGAAETLKLNMALILLPVCRNTITWLRSTLLGSIVSFDDNINFHKTVAGAIVIGIFLHGGNHLMCDFPRILRSSDSQFYKYLGSDFKHEKPDSYLDFIVSVEGITGICMLILMFTAILLATRWFRRNLIKLPKPFYRLTGFNAFWYSHHLFVVVYLLLIVHSFFLYLSHDWWQKTTWIYLAIPMILYTGERTLRALRAGHYTVQILKAAIYPGNVLALCMTKPPGFKYKSGMYMFLQCPDISPFEWHPFSITSAPGDAHISVHIRTLGDWTSEMKRVFSEIMEPPVAGKSGLLRADYKHGVESRFPKLRIDGPYGAPAQDYEKYDVLLLVGLGIGATPFISILKDLLNLIKLGEQQPDSSSDGSKSSEGRSPWRRKKHRCPKHAYFYWVTREQSSFEWFRGVLNEVEEIDNKEVIEMHNYLTNVYEEDDASSSLITMLQALHHAKNGVDIVSGTRVRTHFARPNWRKVFSRIASTYNTSTIGVFYCGPLILARDLKRLARHYSHSSSARFEFHKENF